MGSNESHFNASLIARDKIKIQCPHKSHPFGRERRAEAESNRGLSAYQPNALPRARPCRKAPPPCNIMRHAPRCDKRPYTPLGNYPCSTLRCHHLLHAGQLATDTGSPHCPKALPLSPQSGIISRRRLHLRHLDCKKREKLEQSNTRGRVGGGGGDGGGRVSVLMGRRA